jgi:hypothetical protein
MCAPLEGGSGRGLTRLLEVVRYIWGTEKLEVKESWLVGKLRVPPKSESAGAISAMLFLCYIQAVLETPFPIFEAAGIEKLMF